MRKKIKKLNRKLQIYAKIPANIKMANELKKTYKNFFN